MSLTRLPQIAAATLIAVAIAGCPPSYVNKDGVYKDALLLPAVDDHADPDGIDAGKGDVSDWKYVEPGATGEGQLRLTVGDLFGGTNRHGVKDGAVTVKNSRAETLAQERIVSGKQEYKLAFPVTKGERIFIVVEAREGRDQYRLTFGVTPGCKDCSEGEICKNGQCTEPIKPPPAVLCDPTCGRKHFCLKGRPDRAPRCVKAREKSGLCASECERIFDVTRKFLKINFGENKSALSQQMASFKAMKNKGLKRCIAKCQSGAYDLACLSGTSNAKRIPECEVACGGPCRKGFRCDVEADECVRTGSKCKSCKNVTCPTTQKCRCGRCRTKKVKPPVQPACSPPCKKPYTCNAKKGKCILKLGPIPCRIIQVTPSGSKSHLLLSRGKAHKVAAGDRGSVPGVGTFTVKKVFANRSKATINKPSSALAGQKSCSINRKKWKP